MRKLKKGDTVKVIAGKDKGRSGIILQVLPKGLSVVVEGINRVKRHVKPNPAMEKPGGIVEKEAPIASSNVALLNTKTNEIDKVKIKQEGDRRVRVFRSTGEVIE